MYHCTFSDGPGHLFAGIAHPRVSLAKICQPEYVHAKLLEYLKNIVPFNCFAKGTCDGMKKTFVIDTNILLNNPASIFKFDDNDVVIPISVIEEVDTFKKDLSETGRNAREVSRILDRLRERGTLSAGIPLFDGRDDSGRLFVNLGADYEIVGQLAKNTDNQILAVALTLQKQHGSSRKVVIITKDSNLRIKADALNIAAEDFEADKVDISH
jgi:PhoH-like ATPase